MTYAIRLPANQVIQEQIQPLLERPHEWPSREPIVSYHDFAYQAQSWHLPRRVVAKVEWHQGELFPRVGFIVTNLRYPPLLMWVTNTEHIVHRGGGPIQPGYVS